MIVGQRSKLDAKNRVLTSLLPSFEVRVRVKVKDRSRSKVGVKVTLKVKVKDQSQISGVQRSIFGARLCRVQQRAKKTHYQSEVFVCVSSNHADVVDWLLI